MKGFIYDGRSTEDIIGIPLILCTTNDQDKILGVSSERKTGNQTLTRSTPNEYGTLHTLLSIEYSLIKQGGGRFTEEEQVKVESWLTSPNFSKDLYLIDCDLNRSEYFYTGEFVETNWIIGNGGFAGVSFKFQCNTAYPKKLFTHTYDISGSASVIVDCKSDDVYDYVYPTVKFSRDIIADEGIQSEPKFTLKSVTDGNRELKAIIQSGTTIVLDCLHCIPWNYLISENDNVKTLYDYKDLGWQDIGNIYWPRLVYGPNEWAVSGQGKLVVSYSSPYKKVGGWL